LVVAVRQGVVQWHGGVVAGAQAEAYATVVRRLRPALQRCLLPHQANQGFAAEGSLAA